MPMTLFSDLPDAMNRMLLDEGKEPHGCSFQKTHQGSKVERILRMNGCFGLIAAAMSLDRLSCACNRNTFVGFPPFNLSLLMLVFAWWRQRVSVLAPRTSCKSCTSCQSANQTQNRVKSPHTNSAKTP